MLTLHEIKDTYFALLDIMDSLDEADQEQRLLIEQGLKINADNFNEKAHNYTKFIHSQEKDIEVIDLEVKRLNALKKSKQGKIDYLKSNLVDTLKFFNKSKLEFSTLKLSLKKSISVEIVDLEKIPEIYIRVKNEKQADKNMIKEALKNGEIIDGVVLSEKDNLVIR